MAGAPSIGRDACRGREHARQTLPSSSGDDQALRERGESAVDLVETGRQLADAGAMRTVELARADRAHGALAPGPGRGVLADLGTPRVLHQAADQAAGRVETASDDPGVLAVDTVVDPVADPTHLVAVGAYARTESDDRRSDAAGQVGRVTGDALPHVEPPWLTVVAGI